MAQFYTLKQPQSPWGDYSDILISGMPHVRARPLQLNQLFLARRMLRQIVHLDWQEWDQTSEDPEEYPEGGEPESYILGPAALSGMRARMGDLWEVLLEENATVQRKGKPARIVLVESSWSGGDLFRSADVGYIYATKAKAWLEEHVPEHVAFSEVEVV